MRQYPSQLMVELDRVCNLKCRGCYYVPGDVRMTLPVFRRLIARIAEQYSEASQLLPVLSPWLWSEPMMVPDIGLYLRAASELGYSINLTTNGTIPLDGILTDDIEYHLLVVSIDGAMDKTYRAIRGRSICRARATLAAAEAAIVQRGLDVPVCVKLTRKGAEWAECLDFIEEHLSRPTVKMVAISEAFGDDNGPRVLRHPCRYLTDFFIIQHDMRISPCCMRAKAVAQGLGVVSIDDPMGSFFTVEREALRDALDGGYGIGYCIGCTAAYTGDVIEGVVKVAGREVRFKRDFSNMFLINPDYQGAR